MSARTEYGDAMAPSPEEAEEITRAQFDLNHHPNFSLYWESRTGQDALTVARIWRLKAETTEQFRREWHADQMSAAMEVV